VLALGAGLARPQSAQLQTASIKESLGVKSFGIIAIASIVPVITVLLLLVLIDKLVPVSTIDSDVVVAMGNATNTTTSFNATSPVLFTPGPPPCHHLLIPSRLIASALESLHSIAINTHA
jgi:hypothetical protein